MKKHKSQMTAKELDLLADAVEEVDIASVNITKYTYRRFKERMDGLGMIHLAEIFIEHEIVEFNTNSGDRRVLLRGTKDLKTSKGSFNACLVYSLRSNNIVTAWLNDSEDHHSTLRIDEYNENLKISW